MFTPGANAYPVASNYCDSALSKWGVNKNVQGLAKRGNRVVLVPYIVLGVGIDDMVNVTSFSFLSLSLFNSCFAQIIVLDSFQNELDENPGDLDKRHELLGKALSISGVSITLTSMCSIAAFAVGAASSLLAVESFCVHAAFAFLANDILQFLILIPFMVFDQKRMDGDRNFCFCFFRHKINARQKSTAHPNENETFAPFWEKCNIRHLLAGIAVPIAENRAFRWIIIVCFSVLACLGAYSVEFISTVSDVDGIVPDDSYLLDYIDAMRALMAKDASPGNLEIIVKNVDFSDFEVQSRGFDMLRGIESLPLSTYLFFLRPAFRSRQYVWK